jgi:hypothetical protein
LTETPNCVDLAYDDVRSVRHGTQWSQQNYLKPPLATANAYFGVATGISGDGSTVAIGACIGHAQMYVPRVSKNPLSRGCHKVNRVCNSWVLPVWAAR